METIVMLYLLKKTHLTDKINQSLTVPGCQTGF